MLALGLTSPAFAGASPFPPSAGACPAVQAIGNFATSNVVGASFSITSGDVVTYTLDTANRSPVDTNKDGYPDTPGVIAYCVYPKQPPGNPTAATAIATGADGSLFEVATRPVQGYFAYTRSDGNPSNIPLDGTLGITVGTATWPLGTAPNDQDILIHINDAAECADLYPDEKPETCFVRPISIAPSPPIACPGNTPACKQVEITDADGNLIDPSAVPAFTPLNLTYTYVIQNPFPDPMQFIIPTAKTKDINSGGGKDYYGCEQIPDPNGSLGGVNTAPGATTLFPNWLTGPNGGTFQLKWKSGGGLGCSQSSFFLTADRGDDGNTTPGVGVVNLNPGQSMTFTIDMNLRVNQGGNQEFTRCGEHILNSGFTIKWFFPGDPLMHDFSTNTSPLIVNVVGCP
jgi:hypothetical protein